jgi:serine/threonine protein kinase
MQITFANAQGIHFREINGVQVLKEKLPPDWYAFANLEVINPGQTGRQVDIAIVMDDRIMLADIKDWHGRITSDETHWYQNDRRMERSPVNKIAENVRIVATLLKGHVKKHLKIKGDQVDIPLIDSCVILTGKCNIDGIDEREQSRVFHVDQFCRIAADSRQRYKSFLVPNWIDRKNPLVARDSVWRQRLHSFFTGRNGNFRAQEKTYAGHRVTSDAVYSHPEGVYVEHDCVEVNSDRSAGLLRLWDFGKAPVKFASEEYRQDIAGREQRILAYLNDRDPEIERISLRPKTSDPDNGIRYWEIFEKRKQLRRLRDFIGSELSEYGSAERLDILRVALSHATDLHRMGAAHLDLGEHSLWVEMPATVRMSHFLAAHYGENRSLANDRYAFLGNRTVMPEDILGGIQDHFRRDVFLLGRIAHLFLFGTAPIGSDGNPPEWDSSVDPEGRYANLHDWFGRALDTDPEGRFTDASEMLEAYNIALGGRADTTALIERLQRHRKWRSLLQMLKAFPDISDPIKDDDRVLIYVSEFEGAEVIVKLWKSSNWKDERTDAARLLEFCERAELLSLQPAESVARVREVGYLGDHLVVVTEHVGDDNLSKSITRKSIPAADALHFVNELIDAVNGLHAFGFGHGDLSPENIAVRTDAEGALHPVLIDVLEFGSVRGNPAYSPSFSCGALERDRFAVLKIAEELLLSAPDSEDRAALIASAIEFCRTSHPRFATLQPLKDAIERILNPKVDEVVEEFRIRMVGLDGARRMLADEGRYYLQVFSQATEKKISIVGANSELVVFLDRDCNARKALFRVVDQSKVATASRKSVATLTCAIQLEPSLSWEFGDFEPFLSNQNIMEALGHSAAAPVAEEGSDVLQTTAADGAVEEDQGIDGTESVVSQTDLDVPGLWKALIEIETELSTEVVAEEDSHYSREFERHFVSYSRTRGTFDYDRNDVVEVKMRHPKRDAWIKLGRLDVDRTTGKLLAIDTGLGGQKGRGPLCHERTVLRLESLFEVDSRNRRDRATKRILGRRSVIQGLIDYFDPKAEPETKTSSFVPEADWLMSFYGLNRSQAESFQKLWSTGPVGLLQGPPGTGKTTFIAAFVHFALTEGRMRNVLLASQSHEAVNNAAEDIMNLFRKHGEMPSLVRVGQEGVVSDRLMPFHSAHVETLYRERFKARLKENYVLVGKRLSLPDDFVEMYFQTAITLRPVLRQIQGLKLDHAERKVADGEFDVRFASLVSTVSRMAETIGLPEIDLSDSDDDAVFRKIINRLAKAHSVTNLDAVTRLMRVMRLADDWLGHVGSRRRNFEEFLVNTRQIVCGTCVGLGRSSLGLSDAVFDLVVVDEAARCTPGEIAVPLQSGKRALLVGDHLQLEPFHDPEVVEAAAHRLFTTGDAIRESDFKRAFRSSYGRANGQTLKTQYRMLDPIGRLVSKVFYEPDVRLEHGRKAPNLSVDLGPGSLKSPLTWIDTSELGSAAYQSKAGSRGGSLLNHTEADAIVRLLGELDDDQNFREWLSRNVEEGTQPVGVICAYSGQKALLGRKVAASGISPKFIEMVKIDTVDSYQGKQNLIVVLSLVRNNADGAHGTIRQGFMSRANRINVALSRAMDRLVVVGSMRGWPSEGPMAAVVSAVRELEADGQATVITAGQAAGERQ